MKVKFNRKWILPLVNALLLLLAAVCAVWFWIIASKLDTIHAAERWRGDSEMRFAQLACFLPVDTPKTEEDIFTFRRTLEQKLTDASLITEPGGSLYADAYSGTASLTVQGDKGTATVKAIGIGGDFFLFHPLQLLSGSYIAETDLMQDRVVLDEVLAWQLFGAQDVTGMTVYIDSQPYYVAGVVRLEDDFATEKAYLEEAEMFVCYSAFETAAGDAAGITCYELVMPDMIGGYAMSIVEENFPVGTGDIVENSSRYSLDNLLKTAGDFGLRSMRSNGVIYPYWENAVRLTEDYLALLAVLLLILLACPAVTLVVLAIILIVRLVKGAGKRIPGKIEDLIEARKEKNYVKAGE